MRRLSIVVVAAALAALALAACTEKVVVRESSSAASPRTAKSDPRARGGLALYTLRDTMARDPREVLKEVADMTYAYIEAAGYEDGRFYGMPPGTFRRYLEQVGLRPVSTHMGMVTLENLDRLIADTKEAGFTYFVIPVPPMGAFAYDPETQAMSMSQDVETVMANLNRIAARCAEAGLQCLYHNHDFEFRPDAEGRVPMEYFLEHSDPTQLNFELDLYWATRAGADPVDYFDRYPGRFKAWHVKDMDEEGRFAPVGAGKIDFARILDAREQSGMEVYFVEQDETFDGQTPLQAVRESRRALQELGF